MDVTSMRLVLDTDIIFETKQRLLDGPEIMAIATKRRPIQFVVTEVVKIELVNQYRQTVRERKTEIDKHVKHVDIQEFWLDTLDAIRTRIGDRIHYDERNFPQLLSVKVHSARLEEVDENIHEILELPAEVRKIDDWRFLITDQNQVYLSLELLVDRSALSQLSDQLRIEVVDSNWNATMAQLVDGFEALVSLEYIFNSKEFKSESRDISSATIIGLAG